MIAAPRGIQMKYYISKTVAGDFPTVVEQVGNPTLTTIAKSVTSKLGRVIAAI